MKLDLRTVSWRSHVFVQRNVNQSIQKKAAVVALFLGSILPGQAQVITTSAGSSTWTAPNAVAVDSQGNQYVASYGNNVIFKVDRLGASSVVAGSMNSGGYSGDGGLATNAKLNQPQGVAVDSSGSIYIADSANYRIRKVSPEGIITTIGGGSSGFSGDGGPAINAKVQQPLSVHLDSAQNVLFADSANARIRKISPAGTITTVAGIGDFNYSGDGGPALLAGMRPQDFVVGPDGSIFVTDSGGAGLSPRVRRINPGGIISTVAGNGERGFSGDGGPATAASFNSADGLALDSAGNLFISDSVQNRIRKVAPNGIITTYAGTGRGGYSGDGGPATNATLSGPTGLYEDAADNLYVADYYNGRVRKIAPAAGPAISTNNAGQPSFLGKAAFTSNTYLEIYGTNLAQTTRTWGGADFNGPNAPTSLGGVSVTINGKPAFVYYTSPTQINVNTPDDTATGPVQVQVTNSLGVSNTGAAVRARVSPTLQTVSQFLVGGKQYVVAQTPDFKSFIGRPNMITGVAFTPAKPGDTVSIYALGCGPTNPTTQAGVVSSQAAPLMLPYQVNIGGVPARVTFAGIVANSIGLYQFNVVIPAVSAGDQSIDLTVDGVANLQNLAIVVGN